MVIGVVFVVIMGVVYYDYDSDGDDYDYDYDYIDDEDDYIDVFGIGSIKFSFIELYGCEVYGDYWYCDGYCIVLFIFIVVIIINIGVDFEVVIIFFILIVGVV